MSGMSAVVAVFITVLSLTSSQQDFHFEAQRVSATSNQFILRCITDEFGEPNQDAIFMRNGTDLSSFGPVEPIPQGGSIFNMNRQQEGEFTCGLMGDDRTSNSESLVGK